MPNEDYYQSINGSNPFLEWPISTTEMARLLKERQERLNKGRNKRKKNGKRPAGARKPS